MVRYKFPVQHNPFGVLYNPASISNSLRLIISDSTFTEDDLCFHNDLWFSLNHDTSFSRQDREECLAAINNTLQSIRAFLKKCRYLFLSFGTAWIYVYKKTGKTAANCHKLPAAEFDRRLLGTEETIMDYKHLIEELLRFNPDLKLIFTVSPIRHFKDGAFNNQVSKSILFLVIHALQNMHANIHYFPAYEVFMDELRDYRFYAADMLHPSDVGIDYIWERFGDIYFDESAKIILAGADKIHKAIAHRPYQKGSPGYKSFIENTLEQINRLGETYPFLDFNPELKQLAELNRDNKL